MSAQRTRQHIVHVVAFGLVCALGIHRAGAVPVLLVGDLTILRSMRVTSRLLIGWRCWVTKWS